VMIDGVENANVVFNAVAFVSSPRMAYGVRSTVLFGALNRLRAAGIEMNRPAMVMVDRNQS
jgi:potassium-dependent mechanosensitive channel